KEQQWVIPVVTVSADTGTLVERRKLPAFIPATPDTRNIATTPVSGLTFAQKNIPFPRVGDTVTEGQILALVVIETMTGASLARNANLQSIQSLQVELTARAIETSGDAARARALTRQHAIALNRSETLLEAGAASQREVDTLRGTLAEARAALEAAERATAQAQEALQKTQVDSTLQQTSSIIVAAPISGRITHVIAGPGTRVTEGDPLFEIVNTEVVMIEAHAPESLVATLPTPPSGVFEIPGTPGKLHDILLPENAPSPWILPEVDTATRTIPILFHAANPEKILRIGMSLNLWLDINHVEKEVRIPNTAVIDENGISIVYVMLEGESFQKRKVRLGITDGVYSEVLEGVYTGERVVSHGAYTVRLASLAGAGLGSAHVH
ncbi:MAG: efflux RND transporter periplasmic adaptor subunit, partial [Candidatus Hydrogenedentes bacterium]|nr:efflux RND transporter periplasmic adaptor subunit [Candidatus Hydrogenedentota bacterium]